MAFGDLSSLRLRAPELRGRRWLNTGGRDLSLADLRGRVVVLDFWTFCCVNCLHVLDELRPLEKELGDELVIVGVHSPKFEHEGRPEAVEAAVERYAVHHPVLDDPELVTWKAYTARAWPTLVVIDPEGYIVATLSGEGHGPGLAATVRGLLEEHRAAGTLATGPGPYLPPPPAQTPLRYPGKVAALPDGSLLVSDTAHHEIVRLAPDLATELARYGGPGELDEPQGLLVLPEEVAARVGYEVVLADSVNHQVKGLRLADGALIVLAGTGEQLRERSGGGAALRQPLSTPWDLAWWIDRVVIAMAGTHQLWALHLAPDPADGTVAVLAGTSEEGLRDGPAHEAWLAQPSGLAASASGERVWVADAETSALRSIVLTDDGFEVVTHTGTGLFDFGHRDGPAGQALMQHPLGVCELPDGSVALADTYNGAIRRYDPATGEMTTLASGLAEPSDLVVETGDGPVRLLVVESAAHRLVRVPLPQEAQRVDGPARATQRPPTALRPGKVRLEVPFTPPPGQRLDDRWGDPTRLMVSASPPELLVDGGGAAQGLGRDLVLASGPGAPTSGVLHVSVQAAACDGHAGEGDDASDEPAATGAACHLYQQDWGVPVELAADGFEVLTLPLRG